VTLLARRDEVIAFAALHMVESGTKRQIFAVHQFGSNRSEADIERPAQLQKELQQYFGTILKWGRIYEQ
jgi:hypothetical protein